MIKINFASAGVISYKISDYLGKGSFAKCYKAIDEKKNEYALKIIDKKSKNSINEERILNEINIHKLLNHDNIVKFYDYLETENEFFILMELCINGALIDHINKIQAMSEIDVFYYSYKLFLVLEYLHSLNIIHRDIKLHNILLDKNKNIKLCDFGLAVQLKNKDCFTRTQCGTPNYTAPEILQKDNKRKYNFSVDI